MALLLSKGLLSNFESEKMIDRFRVGVITSSHGIKGEAKVYPTSDDSNRLKKIKINISVLFQAEMQSEIL